MGFRSGKVCGTTGFQSCDAGRQERRGGVPAGEGSIPYFESNAFTGAIVGRPVTTLFGMKRMPSNVVILESPAADMG